MEFMPGRCTRDTYKCLILGDSGVGKSTFLRRHATGQFEEQHVPTYGLNVHTLPLETNYKSVALEMWDVAGDPRHGGLHNGYFFYARCAIIMFDLSSASSASSVAHWQRQLADICGKQLPVVVCGNKAELERMCPALLFRQQPNVDYCEMSSRAAWNMEAPLELLCRQLLRLKDLKLISQPVLKPARNCEFNVAKMRKHMDEVKKKMLPARRDEDDINEILAERNLKQYIVLN
ncbi:PREDICTED: GTP-binding nuclear protein GSP1/Ran-like [Drosophila arizonae]|uniref:GTP-binding nuclear protein GSP1/Ran-like n=1 Tax=Drosophila arizonae TaxID=7263 RepID=A0ABM1NZX8_DROAR|nr:PREDICTED: GTP-binding nuclear protein GSP1/Ran-like [Drosophila arizonae]